MIIIMLITRRKNPLFFIWEVNGSSFEQTWIPLPKDALCQVWLKYLNFVNAFLLFRNYLPLEKGWHGTFIWTNLNPHHPKEALCQVCLKLAKWFWRRFLNYANVFSLFRNYLSLVKGWAVHSNKLESSSPKDALCPVWLNWPSGSRKKIFQFRQCIFAILK